MWASKGYGGKKEQDHGLVAVAIDKDKGSQYAIRWAIDHLLSRGRAIVLIHVTSGSSFAGSNAASFFQLSFLNFLDFIPKLLLSL